MTSRERVYQALTFGNPDRVPRELWVLPAINMFHQEDLEQVLRKYPPDFAAPPVRYGPSRLARGKPAEVGSYTDAWGCTFSVAEPGVIGEVKEPALADLADLSSLQVPWELLEEADFSAVDAFCVQTDKFVKAGTTVRPFERLQFIRGTENLFLDLAYDSQQFRRLKNIVHDFFLREMELWAKTGVDAVSFMDDWGAQNSLLISPAMWRAVFKPLYRDYCQIIHDAGKFVFFHSDGYITDIIPDLIEIGVDALNSQLFCMNIEELGCRHRGQITFWGEIDRQRILPFGTVAEVKKAVQRVRSALGVGNAGVIAQCEWGKDVPRENVEAVFEAWL